MFFISRRGNREAEEAEKENSGLDFFAFSAWN